MVATCAALPARQLLMFPHKEPGTRPHPTHTGSRALLRGRLRPWQCDYTCKFLPPTPPLLPISALRAAELPLSVPVKLNRRPWQCALEERKKETAASGRSVCGRRGKFKVRGRNKKDGNSISRTREVSMKKYDGFSQVRRGTDWIWI